jgi:hypothetical protein
MAFHVRRIDYFSTTVRDDPATAPGIVGAGLKIIADFAEQFPQVC